MREQLLGIEDRDLDVENVREGLHPFHADALGAVLVELLARLRRFVLHQPHSQELLAELFEVFELEAFGAKAVFEGFLGGIEGVLAVHEVEEKIFLFLEAVVAQADGVLDDVVGASLVALRHDAEVGAAAQTHHLASFKVAGRSGVFHMNLRNNGFRREGEAPAEPEPARDTVNAGFRREGEAPAEPEPARR